MKICPMCNRQYDDDNNRKCCAHDGAVLQACRPEVPSVGAQGAGDALHGSGAHAHYSSDGARAQAHASEVPGAHSLNIGSKNVIGGDVICGNPGAGSQLHSFSAPMSTGMNVGDKNVVGGDMIGRKEEVSIAGSATFIRHEDQTKIMQTCHACGHHVLQLSGYTCPACGEFVCSDCYDSMHKKCKDCLHAHRTTAREKYEQFFEEKLDDDRIDPHERIFLDRKATELGISPVQANAIEETVRQRKRDSGASTNEWKRAERKLRYAEDFLWGKCNAVEALECVAPLYEKFQDRLKVAEVYLYALAQQDLQLAQQAIEKRRDDTKIKYLILSEIYARNGEFDRAQDIIESGCNVFDEGDPDLCAQEVTINLDAYRSREKKRYLQDAQDALERLADHQSGSAIFARAYYKFMCGDKMAFKKGELDCRAAGQTLFFFKRREFLNPADSGIEEIDHSLPEADGQVEGPPSLSAQAGKSDVEIGGDENSAKARAVIPLRDDPVPPACPETSSRPEPVADTPVFRHESLIREPAERPSSAPVAGLPPSAVSSKKVFPKALFIGAAAVFCIVVVLFMFKGKQESGAVPTRPGGSGYAATLQEGKRAFDQGRYELCIARMSEILRSMPAHSEAALYKQKAEWQLAEAKRQQQEIDAYFADGKSYYDKGKYELCIAKMDEVLKRIPDHGEAHTYKRNSQLRLDQIAREFMNPTVGRAR